MVFGTPYFLTRFVRFFFVVCDIPVAMEKHLIIKYVIAATVLGVFCICILGRPSSGQAAPFTWAYTTAPTPLPSSTLGADLQAVVSSTAAVATTAPLTITPPPAGLGTDIVEPTVQASQTVLTTAPAPFVGSSVVGKALRDAIATVAKNMPGSVIRPYPQGTSLPPGPANPNRISVAYDPVTLTVTSVQSG